MDLILGCTLEVKVWEVVKRREERKRGVRVLQRERMGKVLGLLMSLINRQMMKDGGEEIVVEALAGEVVEVEVAVEAAAAAIAVEEAAVEVVGVTGSISRPISHDNILPRIERSSTYFYFSQSSRDYL
jgi:hypothetical protein